MTIEDTISQDLKTAMLAKDAQKVSVLRSLKSAFIYAKVAPGAQNAEKDKEAGLTDTAALAIIAKEAKKRQESADSFRMANQEDRALTELAERAIIDAYLPAQLSEDDVRQLVEKAVAQLDEISPKAMGVVIGSVKQQAGPSADGALIARLVKERLAK